MPTVAGRLRGSGSENYFSTTASRIYFFSIFVFPNQTGKMICHTKIFFKALFRSAILFSSHIIINLPDIGDKR